MNKRNAWIIMLMIIGLSALGIYMALIGSKKNEKTPQELHDECFAAGERYESHEVYLKAAASYKQAYSHVKDFTTAVKAGDMAYKVGNISDIEKFYREAMALDKTNAEPFEKLMNFYMKSYKFKKAYAVYKDAAEVTENRDKLEEYYNIMHGGFYESGTNINAFEGWYYDYCIVTIAGKQGVIDGHFENTTAFIADKIGMIDPANNLVPMLLENKWIYCTFDGDKNSVAFGYDEYGGFSDGWAAVRLGEKWGFINIEGNHYNTEAKAWEKFDNYEKDPKELNLEFDGATGFNNGVAFVKKDGRWAILSSTMEFVTDYIFEDVITNEYNFLTVNHVMIAKKDGAYSLFNAKGERIGDATFEDAKPVISGEPIAAKKDGKWGFVDLKGDWVIEAEYQDAASFDCGYAPVKNAEGKWGYVDLSGAMEIEPQFSEAGPFSHEGYAIVRRTEDSERCNKILLYEYMD